MPLFAWSVLSYAAALIVALSVGAGARSLLVALALVGAVALTAWRRRVPAIVCAIVGAAALTSQAVLAHEGACASRLEAAPMWQVAFENDVEPGDLVHASVERDGCTARATLLVASGNALGGTDGTVTGRATADPRGLFIEDAAVASAPGGSSLLAVRAAAGRRIDRIFGTDAPMARALVIADMSAIPPEARDRYANAGLVHMLSVSGLHVGIVALALELLASVLRLPRTPARVATLLLLAAYVAAIGAPPPAVRAAVMLGALLTCRLLQRPTSPWAILALGAVAPLWDPRIALDLGWQLSVAGTAALIAGGTLGKRIIPRRWSGTRRTLAAGGVVSLVATAVTAPLVAWAFGRVALLGPITNLLADPIMGLLQPLLFIALAIPIHAVEALAADASHVLLFAFDGIARVAASVPGAAPTTLPSTVGALAAGTASVSLVVACIKRQPMRPIIVGAAAVGVIVGEPLIPRMRAPPELHMIDVGQGDAIALRTGTGRWIVVDAGRSWMTGDAGKSTVAPYLARIGGDVALFVLSHPHADHVGGASSLFAMLRPDRFLDPGYVGTTPPYAAALAQARRMRIPWQRVHPGDSIVVDDVVLHELAPDSAWASQLADANLASTVFIATMGKWRVLFTGDAEGPEEEWLLAHDAGSLRADVLKVGHHGSSTSTTPAFLAASHPRLALVSVGAHNSYGHPDAEVIDLLHASRIPTLRTDHLGTIVLTFRRNQIDVTAHGEHMSVPRLE